jgi:WD40 repeat protein
LWDLATDRLLGKLFRHLTAVQAVAFAPDGRTVAVGCQDGTAQLWEVSTSKPHGPALLHGSRVVAVTYSTDGKTLLVGCADGSTSFWDVETGKALGTPLQFPQGVRALAYSPEGNRVLIGYQERGEAGGAVALWEVPAPLQGEVGRIALWAEVITGMEMDEHGAARVLEVRAWEERRDRLRKGVAPPDP